MQCKGSMAHGEDLWLGADTARRHGNDGDCGCMPSSKTDSVQCRCDARKGEEGGW